MHETIDEFFKMIKEKGLKLPEIEDDEIYNLVSKIVDNNLQLSKNFIFTTNAKNRALVQRLKKNYKQSPKIHNTNINI